MTFSLHTIAKISIRVLLILLLFTGSYKKGLAQLTGTKNIPGDYATISTAVTALNTQGVGAGGVTFKVAANSVFNESPIKINVSTNKPTSGNPLTFVKSGTGANPVIKFTGTASTTDAGLMLVGADYTTIDGIDIKDAGTSATNWTEIGLALVRASATDGCQHDTIRNCSITLDPNDINNGYVTFIGTGIYQANSDASFNNLDPTTVSGQNSFNSYYNNTLSGVDEGIVLYGGSAMHDSNNDIGVKGGNTIILGGASQPYEDDGIYLIYVDNLYIANNAILTAPDNNAYFTSAISDFSSGNTAYIYNNYISVSTMQVASMDGLWAYYILGCCATTNFYDNVIENCSTPAGALGNFDGFVFIDATNFNPPHLNIYNNIIRNNHQNATNNQPLTFYSSFNAGNNDVRFYGNQIYNNTSTGGFTIFNIAGKDNYSIYANQIYNDTATYFSIFNAGSNWGNQAGKFNIYNNSFHDLMAKAGSINAITASFSYTPIIVDTNNIYGNQFYNLYATGGITGLSFYGGNSVYNIYNNNFYSLTSPSGVTAISMGTNSATPAIYNNFIADLNAPNGFAITGISSNVDSAKIYSNSIYLNQTANIAAAFTSTGLSIGNNKDNDIQNNLIVNISTPGATGRTVAISLGGVAPFTNYAATSDYNSYFAGTPGTQNFIFYSSVSVADQTLAGFQTRTANRDAHSITVNPAFLSPDNLHIRPGSASLVQGKGNFITTYSATDIDWQSRANPPCTGADEVTSGIDLALTGISSPAIGSCYNPSASITFQISNHSSADINFSSTNAIINYTATGSNTTGQIPSGSFTINSGTLTAGAIMDVTVNTAYNMTSTGSYIFNATLTVAGDINNSNNSLSPVYSVVILPPVSAAITSTVSCGTDSVTLYAYGAATYNWIPSTYLLGTTGSSVTCKPAAAITYTVTGTHANGCVSTTTLAVNPGGGVLTTPGPISGKTFYCNNETSGAYSITRISGATSYTWQVSGSGNSISGTDTGAVATWSPSFTGLAVISVVANGTCGHSTATTDSVYIGSISLTLVSGNVTCKGSCNGYINLSLTGSGTNQFIWSNAQTTQNISGLCPGNYSVNVYNGTGCTATFASTITEPAISLSIVLTSTKTSCPDCQDGSATAVVTGGTSPYNYNWSSGSTTSSANNLITGDYTLCVTDANGCSKCDTVNVSVATGTVTLNNNTAITIYPNPNNGIFTITTHDDFNTARVQLLDISGRLIKEELLTGNNHTYQLDMTGYVSQGVYIVQVTTGQTIFRQKLVVE